SVLAQKGGVGKTTLTLHWAVQAQRQGIAKVAVIDLDTQESALAWSKRRMERGIDTPAMLQANEHNLREALAACEAEGMELVLVDTMPRVEKPCIEAAKVAQLG